MTDLGTLDSYSYGNGLNDGGQVVGNSLVHGIPGAVGQYTERAFLYTSGVGMVDLGTLGGATGDASGINNSGQIVGAATLAGDQRFAASHAFLYTGIPGNGGHMADLGTLGGANSGASAINASGQIVGYSNIAGSTAEHAYLYTGTPGSGGHMTDLGTLGSTNSEADAISPNGLIAGSSDMPGGSRRAFLYTGVPGSGGHMSDLGSLDGMSWGYGVNSSGQVVGASILADGSTEHAFIYVGTPGAGGHMIDLNAWLKANNPAVNWTLTIAYGINDNGQVTGWGIDNDPPNPSRERAFLLDASSLLVPEPASFVLLGIGAALTVGIGCYRASRSRR